VQAMTRAQWPTHYLAVSSLSGKPRALFLTRYDSFEAWEKDALATEKNATLSAALDRAGVADGDLLSDVDSTALVYHDEYSLRSSVDIPHMRYFEIALYRVRPGHDADWDSIVKMVIAAYQKIPGAHWATYRAVYGQEGTTYVVFTAMKSAVEIDQSFAQSKQFMSAMGEEGMKKFSELLAAAIESSQHNLFIFSPKMSYPPTNGSRPIQISGSLSPAPLRLRQRRGKKSQPIANNPGLFKRVLGKGIRIREVNMRLPFFSGASTISREKVFSSFSA